MQGLGGLAPGLNRGATMSGNKAGGIADLNPVKLMRVGSPSATATFNFTATTGGLYQIVIDGPGASASGGTGGGAGAKCVKTVRLRKDEVIAFSLGQPDTTHTTATLPDGAVMTARGSTFTSGVGGTATGGDINLPGGNASGGTGGANPSYAGYFGGAANHTPGGGSSTSLGNLGASMATVVYVGM